MEMGERNWNDEGGERGVIDHLVWFVEAKGPEVGWLKSLGLVVAYRANACGAGTQNVCYCFDNLFLEPMWVNDREAARGKAIRRTGIEDGSRWRQTGHVRLGLRGGRLRDVGCADGDVGLSFAVPARGDVDPGGYRERRNAAAAYVGVAGRDASEGLACRETRRVEAGGGDGGSDGYRVDDAGRCGAKYNLKGYD